MDMQDNACWSPSQQTGTKKVLNRLLSVEKLAIVFYLLYFVVRWPFHDIIGGDLQFKSFSLLLRYEDLWAILLRGLLYNENNDWALYSTRLKFLSGLGVKVFWSDLEHLYPMFWNQQFSFVFYTLRICFSTCLKKITCSMQWKGA